MSLWVWSPAVLEQVVLNRVIWAVCIMNNSIEYHSTSCISLYYYIFMQVGAGETANAIIWWCSCLCMCVSGCVWVSVCGSEESGRILWQDLGRTEWLVIVCLLTQWLTASSSWVFLYWIIPDAFRDLHPKLVKYCRGNGIPIRHFDCMYSSSDEELTHS